MARQYEEGMNYPEVCRLHEIGSPEDLDSALADYEMLAEQIRFYIEIKKPYVKDGNLFCPNCRKQISGSENHCPSCGRRIGWEYK